MPPWSHTPETKKLVLVQAHDFTCLGQGEPLPGRREHNALIFLEIDLTI